MRAAVSQKNKKEGGSGMGTRVRVERQHGVGKGEKAHYASEQGVCCIAKWERGASGS